MCFLEHNLRVGLKVRIRYVVRFRLLAVIVSVRGWEMHYVSVCPHNVCVFYGAVLCVPADKQAGV